MHEAFSTVPDFLTRRMALFSPITKVHFPANGKLRKVDWPLDLSHSARSLTIEVAVKMAKSLRSKIKRKFRTELRKRIGVPHQAIQEAKIQENLKKAIAAQGNGKSVASLKKLMGSSVPMASSEITGVVKEQTPAEAEAALLNQEADATMEDVKKAKKDKKKTKKRKSKFVHFHQLRKKGV